MAVYVCGCVVWAMQAGNRRAPSRGDLIESVVWFLLLLIVILVAAVFLLRVRRRFLDDSSTQRNGIGLTLAELREKRDQGELTISEYETLREVVIRSAREGPGETSGDPPDKIL